LRKSLIESRIRMGLTSIDMAEKLKITLRMYKYYESGQRTPSIKRANMLEDLFGLPQRILLKVDDPEKKSTA